MGKARQIDRDRWIEPKEGAKYACGNYRSFLERLKNGEIRCIKRGRKYLTTKRWTDNFLLSLKDNGMLERK